jgi:hypothetical protein
MARSSATAYRSSVVESLLDLLAAVSKLRGEQHLAACIIHNGDPGGAAPGVEFEAERRYLRLLDCPLEDEGKRISFQHGSLSGLEQEACAARMHWGEWLSIGIDEKNGTHWMTPLLFTEPPLARVTCALTMFKTV